MAVISLLSDFGLRDEFVGVMHGVILQLAPSARIVDLCHALAPGDCRRAAYLLSWAWRYFPPRTVHVAIVDPGVGTRRRLLCAVVQRHLFLAPDNGVLTLVLDRAQAPRAAVYEVREPRYWRHPVSATFHGRDILAPVAARLARGLSPRRLGPRTTTWERIPIPVAHAQGRRWRAEVIDIDRFGNVMTNVDAAALARIARPPAQVTFMLNDHWITGIVRTYGDVPRGGLAAVVGSRGVVELAKRDGDAARALKVRVGDTVVVA